MGSEGLALGLREGLVYASPQKKGYQTATLHCLDYYSSSIRCLENDRLPAVLNLAARAAGQIKTTSRQLTSGIQLSKEDIPQAKERSQNRGLGDLRATITRRWWWRPSSCPVSCIVPSQQLLDQHEIK